MSITRNEACPAQLRDLGHDTAFEWLDRHFADLGKRSTVDVRAEFL